MRMLFRVLFLALWVFEACACVGIFHIPLEFTWFGLLFTLSIVVGAIEICNAWLRRRRKCELHWSTWAAIALPLALDVGGDVFGWYERWGMYDQIAHTIGSGVAMIVLVRVGCALLGHESLPRTWRSYAWIALLGAISLGALYEIEEYLEDYFLGSHRLGDGFDTANDLLCDVIGASIAFVCVYAWRRWLLASSCPIEKAVE